MYLPIDHLLPEYQSDLYVYRKKLRANNTYGLAASEYGVTDLYPISPTEGHCIYLIMTDLTNQEHILTAQIEIGSSELALSLRHLQSPQALNALKLLKKLFDQDQFKDERLAHRLEDVFDLYTLVLGDELENDTPTFVETYHRLQAQAPDSELAQSMLDYLEELMSLNDLWPEELKPAVKKRKTSTLPPRKKAKK